MTAVAPDWAGLAASGSAVLFTASQRQGIGVGGVAVNVNTALAAMKAAGPWSRCRCVWRWRSPVDRWIRGISTNWWPILRRACARPRRWTRCSSHPTVQH